MRTLPGRRKAAPKSTPEKIFGAITGAISGAAGSKAAAKAKPSGKRGPAGLALLGAGALAALKNKDKLTSMVKGKGSDNAAGYAPVPATPTTPVTPMGTTPMDDSPSGMRPIVE